MFPTLGRELGGLSAPDCTAGLRVRFDLHWALLGIFVSTAVARTAPDFGPQAFQLGAGDLATPNCAACFGVGFDLHCVSPFFGGSDWLSAVRLT